MNREEYTKIVEDSVKEELQLTESHHDAWVLLRPLIWRYDKRKITRKIVGVIGRNLCDYVVRFSSESNRFEFTVWGNGIPYERQLIIIVSNSRMEGQIFDWEEFKLLNPYFFVICKRKNLLKGALKRINRWGLRWSKMMREFKLLEKEMKRDELYDLLKTIRDSVDES